MSVDPSDLLVRAKYPFFNEAPPLFNALLSNLTNYDATSCGIITNFFRAGMKTVDTMQSQQDCQAVSVLVLLGNIYELSWNAYTAFSQQLSVAPGTNAVVVTSSAFAILTTFQNWDIALQNNPFSNIGLSFSSLVEGVTS